jgi:hypothetical protein
MVTYTYLDTNRRVPSLLSHRGEEELWICMPYCNPYLAGFKPDVALPHFSLPHVLFASGFEVRVNFLNDSAASVGCYLAWFR